FVAAAFFTALFLLLLARLETVPVLKRLAAANTFTFFLLFTLPLTYGGKSFSLGIFQISYAGLWLTGLITLKTNSIILLMMALIATSPAAAIGHALESLKVPRQLCFLFLFSYRYISVIYCEYKKLSRAAELRCFTAKTNIHTLKTTGYLFGMTLIKSWNRAQRIQQAMVLRGFKGQLIPLNTKDMDRKDTIFLVCSLLIIGGCYLTLSSCGLVAK
ncbi:MAG: cobalt ECF transporter T component CbiQ, partial [Desulfobacterales bacterium]